MNSHLLEGVIRHRRARPVTYALEHDVYYLALDLDELPLVDRSLRLLSRDRANLLSFRDGDHLNPPAIDVRDATHAHLRSAGFDPAGWRVTLVAYPRVLGYAFNPASFYLCRDAAGELRVVVVEVHNTHGERHLYTLTPADEHPDFRATMDKDFYVSPFIENRGGYRVLVRDGSSRLRITINQEQDGELVLHASLDLRRRPLTDRAIVAMLVRHPLVTVKTIAMIHWHGFRLWRLGLPFHRHSVTTRLQREAR
jgi:DUF1365 family protein